MVDASAVPADGVTALDCASTIVVVVVVSSGEKANMGAAEGTKTGVNVCTGITVTDAAACSILGEAMGDGCCSCAFFFGGSG